MNDIAASLFTTQYRNEHIAGKQKQTTSSRHHSSSCFDVTKTIEDRAGVDPVSKPKAPEDPIWSKANMTFRHKVEKPDPSAFLKRNAKKSTMEEAIAQPPKSVAFRRRENPPNTAFRRFYDRGDLPVSVDHKGVKNGVLWKVELLKLDYHHYLPIFFDGVRETQEPYRYLYLYMSILVIQHFWGARFLAVKGCEDMMRVGGSKVLPVIPQLIIPIKTALNTRDELVVCIMLRLLQKLVTCSDNIGEALVPYYRQILPIFNLYKHRNRNLGGAMDYGQQNCECLGDLISETLVLFEQRGGEDAFINIKYLVPTYESCINYT